MTPEQKEYYEARTEAIRKGKETDEVKEFEKSIKLKKSKGEQLTPEEVDYYNTFMWRTGEALKQPKKDKFGYSIGQKIKGYRYIGDNKWKEQ